MENLAPNTLKVAIVGVGMGGCVYVSKLNTQNYPVEKIYIDTNAFDLTDFNDGKTLALLGPTGQGTGWNPEKGEIAAKDQAETIANLLGDAKFVIIVAALGRGTGSGAVPVIARVARERKMLVAAFVTQPFNQEGINVCEVARTAYSQLKIECHFLLQLECEKLSLLEQQSSAAEMYEIPRKWIDYGTQRILTLLFSQDKNVRLDFSEFCSIFPVAGTRTLLAVGEGEGENASAEAISRLYNCPLADYYGKCDTAVIILTLATAPTNDLLTEIVEGVRNKFGCKKQLCWRFEVVPEMATKMRICVLGAGEIEAAKLRRSRVVTPADAQNASDELALNRDYTGQEGLGVDDRGIFEGSRQRIYKGVDLEVPTFWRLSINLEKTQKNAKANLKK